MKLIIPLDGSKLAEEALHVARLLTPIEGLEAHLLFVLEPYAGLEWGPTLDQWNEGKKSRRTAAETYLQEQASKLAGVGVPTTTSVTEGHPAREIVAASASADLVVMSTHGLSGLKRWTRGSVADKVIRSRAANTLVVGPHAEENHPRDKIAAVMVPLDGSRLAEQALPLATKLAKGLHARLHLVQSVLFPALEAGSTGYMFDGDIYQGMLDGAKAYLDGVKAKASDVEVETAVLEGQAAVLLGHYINQKSIDLVVMTSHGRGGLIRTALGSVTDRLIGEHAPVLVVHATEDEE